MVPAPDRGVKAMVDYNRLTANAAIEVMNGVKGKSVLVVGCNRGKDCKYFIDLGANEVFGLDVLDDIGSEFNHPHAHYYRASAEDMPFENDKFDLVYCFATMEHIPRIELAFSEMARVTKVGGCVYCVAAPLWNSVQGHHMANYFVGHPWIHLRKSKAEILEYCQQNNITDSDGKTMDGCVNYMLDCKNFNMTPSKAYLTVCEGLPNMLIIQNSLRFDKPSLLTEKIWTELRPKGFSRKELLARTHWYVGMKVRDQRLKTKLHMQVLKLRHFVSTLKRIISQLYLAKHDVK